MALCQSPERTVAAVDSALRAGHLTLTQWMRDIEGLPTRLRDLLSDVDQASESITESITRFRLRRLGFAPRLQVSIAGVGRVDMMIGRRLIIELDGWTFHQSRESFEADRRRDALLTALGYRVLRFTYRQVTRAWHEVAAAISAAVSAEGALAA
jgi:very-short-patch-repair endonuclease